MKIIKAILIVSVLWIDVVEASLVYDFNFESPDFVLNEQIIGGSGYLGNGNVYVRSGIADFSTQVASLEPAGNLSFGVVPSIASGMVSISWDRALVVFGSPLGGNTANFFIGSNTEGPDLFSASFNGDGTLHDSFNNSLGVGYSVGVHNQFQILIDLDADLLDFIVDGSVIVDNLSISPTISPEVFVFGREYLTDPYYAVDNFRWEIIPEPSSLGLLLIGCLAFLLVRAKKYYRNERFR